MLIEARVVASGAELHRLPHSRFQDMTFKLLMPWEQSFQGSDANDSVLNFYSNKKFDLGEGDNVLLDFGRNTKATSGAGNDTFILWGADQDITSDGGNNFVLMFGSGENRILLGDGNDVISAFAGDNFVVSGGGDDVIKTAGGDDNIFAGDGDDELFGGGGHNYMNGGSGDDVLVAQGTVMDAMRGGSGKDIFDISQAAGNIRINDLNGSEGDTIRLTALQDNRSFIDILGRSFDGNPEVSFVLPNGKEITIETETGFEGINFEIV